MATFIVLICAYNSTPARFLFQSQQLSVQDPHYTKLTRLIDVLKIPFKKLSIRHGRKEHPKMNTKL